MIRRKSKYVKKETYSRKNLVAIYLKKFPVDPKETIAIKTIFFDTFNTKNSLDTQRFALDNRCNKNNFKNTDVLILGLRYQTYKILKLDLSLKEYLSSKLNLKVIDEGDLNESTKKQ